MYVTGERFQESIEFHDPQSAMKNTNLEGKNCNVVHALHEKVMTSF